MKARYKLLGLMLALLSTAAVLVGVNIASGADTPMKLKVIYSKTDLAALNKLNLQKSEDDPWTPADWRVQGTGSDDDKRSVIYPTTVGSTYPDLPLQPTDVSSTKYDYDNTYRHDPSSDLGFYCIQDWGGNIPGTDGKWYELSTWSSQVVKKNDNGWTTCYFMKKPVKTTSTSPKKLKIVYPTADADALKKLGLNNDDDSLYPYGYRMYADYPYTYNSILYPVVAGMKFPKLPVTPSSVANDVDGSKQDNTSGLGFVCNSSNDDIRNVFSKLTWHPLSDWESQVVPSKVEQDDRIITCYFSYKPSTQANNITIQLTYGKDDYKALKDANLKSKWDGYYGYWSGGDWRIDPSALRENQNNDVYVPMLSGQKYPAMPVKPTIYSITTWDGHVFDPNGELGFICADFYDNPPKSAVWHPMSDWGSQVVPKVTKDTTIHCVIAVKPKDKLPDWSKEPKYMIVYYNQGIWGDSDEGTDGKKIQDMNLQNSYGADLSQLPWFPYNWHDFDSASGGNTQISMHRVIKPIFSGDKYPELLIQPTKYSATSLSGAPLDPNGELGFYCNNGEHVTNFQPDDATVSDWKPLSEWGKQIIPDTNGGSMFINCWFMNKPWNPQPTSKQARLLNVIYGDSDAAAIEKLKLRFFDIVWDGNGWFPWDWRAYGGGSVYLPVLPGHRIGNNLPQTPTETSLNGKEQHWEAHAVDLNGPLGFSCVYAWTSAGTGAVIPSYSTAWKPISEFKDFTIDGRDAGNNRVTCYFLQKPVAFKIKVVDEDGNTVPNAKFTLTPNDTEPDGSKSTFSGGSTTPVTMTTGQDGVTPNEFYDVMTGRNYKITMDDIAGYLPVGSTNFKLNTGNDNKGHYQLDSNESDRADNPDQWSYDDKDDAVKTITVTLKKITYKVKKTDTASNPLKDAKIKLSCTVDGSLKQLAELSTGDDGLADFTGAVDANRSVCAAANHYELMESEAPANFKKNDGVVVFSLDSSGLAQTVGDLPTDWSLKDNVFTLVDQPLVKSLTTLPKAGVVGIVAVGLVMVLVTAGLSWLVLIVNKRS